MLRNSPLDVGNDPLRLRFAAMDHEPTWAFRNGMAQKNNDQPQHGANPEDQPPGNVERKNAWVGQPDGPPRAHGSPNPETAIDDQVHSSAHACGNQLVNCGVDGGILAANACAR